MMGRKLEFVGLVEKLVHAYQYKKTPGWHCKELGFENTKMTDTMFDLLYAQMIVSCNLIYKDCNKI